MKLMTMLDTYGYRSGGRVGYAEGDMVLPESLVMVSPEQTEIKLKEVK